MMRPRLFAAVSIWLMLGIMAVGVLESAEASDKRADADLWMIKNRLIEMYLDQADEERIAADARGAGRRRAGEPAVIEQLRAGLRADGSWEDLQYASATPRDMARGDYTVWGSTTAHLTRMQALARAYRSPSSPMHGDARLREQTLSALDYWLRNDFRHPGWWQDQIGTPERLGPTLLLLDEHLSPEQRVKGVGIMQRSQIGDKTGANLLWMAGNQIVWGCVANDAEAVAEAYRRIVGEVRIAPAAEEGIKIDHGFYQPGEQLYSGGYGLSFTNSCAHWAFVARGTRFALPPENLKIFADYVLEGQRWMIRGATFDYNAVGREICRPNKDARPLRQACLWLMELCPDRAGDFAALAEDLAHGTTGGPAGNRHFWKCDLMVHRRAEYYASVRMLSPRMLNSECTRGEGLRSRHLADGATYFYRDGLEYRNIFPVWDWRRLPGNTCIQTDRPLIPPEILQPPENPTREENDAYAIRLNRAVALRGVRDFVGGVSDGHCGLAAMDFFHAPISARKAWFFLDRRIVCLGTGIESSSDDPVLTSVNQCLLRGPVAFSSPGARPPLAMNNPHGARPPSAVQAVPLDYSRSSVAVLHVARGRRTLRGPCWVHHDGIGYVFPEEAELTLAAETQRGDWHDIVMSARSRPVAEDVFSLWIDHGRRVAAGNYVYHVVPGVEADAMESLAREPGVRILGNSPALQAVWDDARRAIFAAFYAPGAVESEGLAISADQPCLLIARKAGDGLELAVSNPKNQPLTVHVEVNRRLTGEGCEWIAERKVTRITLNLPGGDAAGQSILRKIDD